MSLEELSGLNMVRGVRLLGAPPGCQPLLQEAVGQHTLCQGSPNVSGMGRGTLVLYRSTAFVQKYFVTPVSP